MPVSEQFDVVIAGGGPAGLTALHWCADLGLTAVLLEKSLEAGGQLLETYNAITNYPGVTAANGRELRDLFLRTMSDEDTQRRLGVKVIKADLAAMTLTDPGGRTYRGRAVIIATGVRRRKLGISGENEFRGRGLLESGAKERNDVAGKRVVIVGGGDAALENALMLAERAAKVFVVHRRATFTARHDFLELASRKPKVEFVTPSRMVSIDGGEKIASVFLENVETGGQATLEADAVLIRIGVEPNTDLFRGQIELDDNGYVVIDRNCATSRPNVFAIGDVANPQAPTIAAAVGQASIAVKAIRSGMTVRKEERA